MPAGPKSNYFSTPSRLILLVTHDCQLRCRYCRVKKFRSTMDEKVLFKAIDLFFNFGPQNLQLQFFGGEPLLKFELIKKGVDQAEKLSKITGKKVDFILTTNGILLDGQKINFLKKHKFLIECSIDDEKIRNQKKYPPVIKNFKLLFRSGILHYSISVFTPGNIPVMFKNFKDLVNWGFKRLQINYCLGVFWEKEKIKELLNQFKKILGFLKSRKDIKMINLTSSRKEPVILNAELTVDCNGDLYWEFGGFLEENFLSLKKRFMIENINKIRDCFFRSLTPSLALHSLMNGYPDKKRQQIILNNIFVGKTLEKLLSAFKNGSAKSFFL